jgi:hypothetical protein
METIEVNFDHLIRENPMGEARKDDSTAHLELNGVL